MDPAAFNFGCLVADLPSAVPAVIAGERTITFGELDRRSTALAGALQHAGVAPGDRVVWLARNRPEFFDLLFAASKAGAVVAGVNFRLSAREVGDLMADAMPRVVVVAPELAEMVPPGPAVVCLGEPFEAWLAGAEPLVAPVAAPGDVVLQLYSSGTTGLPKGVMLTNANLGWTVRMGAEVYGMTPSSTNLVVSPLFHVGGVGYSLTAMGQGATTVLPGDVDPVRILDLIERHRVTHAFLVPTVVRLLLDALADHPADLSSLELVAYGAAPIDDRTLLEAIGAFGCRFLGVYGMTETAGSVTSLAPGDHDPGGPRSGLLRSVGRSLPWHDVVVFDPATGAESAPGEVGEIWVRSPQNMVGYAGRPEQTAESLVGGGWLRTGDAAWRDDEGYLFIKDRLKDLIISGGENIYPAEVERVLAAHPAVGEVAVVGVSHARWGETVKALVVRRPGAEVGAEELVAWSREHLAHYKCPTSVDFATSLPKNAAGKILRRAVRDRYRSGTGS